MSEIEVIQLGDSFAVTAVEIDGGPSSSLTSSYTHVQGTPGAVWVITHHLGRLPVAWSLHDLDGLLCSNYQVQHLDMDSLRVSMDQPTAGTFRCI